MVSGGCLCGPLPGTDFRGQETGAPSRNRGSVPTLRGCSETAGKGGPPHARLLPDCSLGFCLKGHWAWGHCGPVCMRLWAPLLKTPGDLRAKPATRRQQEPPGGCSLGPGTEVQMGITPAAGGPRGHPGWTGRRTIPPSVPTLLPPGEGTGSSSPERPSYKNQGNKPYSLLKVFKPK